MAGLREKGFGGTEGLKLMKKMMCKEDCQISRGLKC
jgi:hypothetical protein